MWSWGSWCLQLLLPLLLVCPSFPVTPFSSHSPLPCLFLVVQSFWKNLAWSACSSCSHNLFSCVSCPLIFEPCHFFYLSPSNWQLLSHYFSLRNLARCSVLEIFSKPKTKTKYKFIFLSVFCLGLFETNYFSSCTQPHLFVEKSDFTRVFDTPVQRKPTASEKQNSTEIVRKRLSSRKHTFPYKAANRSIIVN